MEHQHQAYDIHNPLGHRRVIYDGIENKDPICVDPGQTLQGVPLADHVVDRVNSVPNDLRLTPAGAIGATGRPGSGGGTGAAGGTGRPGTHPGTTGPAPEPHPRGTEQPHRGERDQEKRGR